MTVVYMDESDLTCKLDDIYHSTSKHEMQVKADLHCIDLHSRDVLVFLIDTTTYHAAFWPHTSKRFTAFKALLRSMKDLPEHDSFAVVVEKVCHDIYQLEHDVITRVTPGRRHELKNLKQVQAILMKLSERRKA